MAQEEPVLQRVQSFALRSKLRSKWTTVAILAELGGESAVLNHRLEDEIREAEAQFAIMEGDEYEDQADMSMYSKENLIKRNRLKRHPAMVDGIAEFWCKLNPIKTQVDEVTPRSHCRLWSSNLHFEPNPNSPADENSASRPPEISTLGSQ
jgi:hypothetical protein